MTSVVNIGNGSPSENLEVGQIIELEVGPVAHGGHFISRHNGRVVFLRYAITGERVRAKITQISSKVVRADAVEILEAAAARVSPPCQYFSPGGCGGCDFQHIDLSFQRALKLKVLIEQFARIGGIDILPLAPDVQAAPGDKGLHWRTRVDFATTPSGQIGFYKSRSKDVLAVKDCLVVEEKIGTPELSKARYRGGERVTALATSTGQVAVFQGNRQLAGEMELTERVAGYNFHISKDSFWQGHKSAAQILVNEVLEQAAVHPQEVVLDLYGGAGLFSAALAAKVGPNGKVIMIEMEGSSIQDAERNFAGAKNVQIVKGRVERALAKIERADVVVLDPPRIGCDAMAINEILRLLPRRVVYVSCDPASLARDVKLLVDGGYKLERVQGFDLFPMTAHLESVVTLTHR